jgi:hypothetical protein
LYKSVPVLAVRFAPSLDDQNRGVAGRALTIPVSVERNGSSSTADVRKPQVQVSYDEGTTWRTVPVFKVRDKYLVTLLHPKNAKSVSLKAKASDANGSVEQTIIRAYDLK